MEAWMLNDGNKRRERQVLFIIEVIISWAEHTFSCSALLVFILDFYQIQ